MFVDRSPDFDAAGTGARYLNLELESSDLQSCDQVLELALLQAPQCFPLGFRCDPFQGGRKTIDLEINSTL